MTRNVSHDEDIFICAECGVTLYLVEISGNYENIVNGELNYCPNCGEEIEQAQ